MVSIRIETTKKRLAIARLPDTPKAITTPLSARKHKCIWIWDGCQVEEDDMARKVRKQETESEVENQEQTKPKFRGFVPPKKNFFLMPNELIDINAEIDNLAELKVVQYVLRHTWGYQEEAYEKPGARYNKFKHITIDEFMHGRAYKRRGPNGEVIRMDKGTGLSEMAVRNGIKRAVEDGYIECEEDASDKARIKKYYKLRIFQPEEEVYEIDPEESSYQDSGVYDVGSEVYNVYPEVSNNGDEVYDVDPRTYNEDLYTLQDSPRSSKYNKEIQQEKEDSSVRVFHPSQNFSGKRRVVIPQFLQGYIIELAAYWRDDTDVRSNIKRADNIFRASGVSEDEFYNAMIMAKELATKKHINKLNTNGKPCRMPYFFSCLCQEVGVEYNREGRKYMRKD